MSEPTWLETAAARRPDHPALVTPDGVVSYAVLARSVRRLAARLADAGLGPGDRVAVWLPNSRLYVELVHAALALGAALVPLNRRLQVDEVRGLLDQARPRLLVGDRSLPELGVERLDPEPLTASAIVGPELAPRPLDPEAELALLFTSGTSGTPKGVPLQVAQFAASAAASAERLGREPDDRWLVCMPLYHIGGLSIPIRSAIQSTTAVLHEDFDPSAVARALARERIRVVSLVPTMLGRVLEAGLAERPAELRVILLGGGPIAPGLVERCRALGLPLAPTYGLTEACSQVATGCPGEPVATPGCVGRPLPGTEVRIVDAGDRVLAAGEIGEICVRGPQVMRGYLDREADSGRALRGGWLHTGDAGHLEPDGSLVIHDRRDDLIVSGGENVYPAEVEAALCAHPNVLDAGVIARPDPEWGQRVHAVVVAPGLDEAALREWLRPRLAGFKRPRAYDFAEALPRTASGKLRRAELRARYAS